MREMLDEFVEKPKEESGENKLEMALMSRSEKRKAKRQRFKENTEGMNFKQKMDYIFYAYGTSILITTIVCVCAFILIFTFYKNSRPASIAYAVVNCEDSSSFNSELIEEYVRQAGLTKGHQIISDKLVTLDPEVFQNGNNTVTALQTYTDFSMLCENGNYDIIISDKAGAEVACAMDRMNPLDTYLPQDLYEKIKDKTISLSDSAGNVDVYAIDISDTEFGKNLNTGYSKIYILLPGVNEENLTNSVRIIKYIFNIQ